MDIRVILMLAAVGAFALALLYKEGLLKKPAPIVIAVMLTALALVLRALVFGYETLDYQNFLTRWVDFFRQNGGWRALSEPVGNYNIPYLYFMALFSYSSVKDLYLIKLLSTVFDVLLAYSAMRLVSRWQKSAGLRLGCFFTVLLWPTVFLNSAVRQHICRPRAARHRPCAGRAAGARHDLYGAVFRVQASGRVHPAGVCGAVDAGEV